LARVANRKTITVTAENGVTGRTWFGKDPDNTNGILGKVNAINVKVKNTEAAGGNSSRYQLNHRTGDLSASNAGLVEAAEEQEIKDGDFQCISYVGVGADVTLRITVEW